MQEWRSSCLPRVGDAYWRPGRLLAWRRYDVYQHLTSIYYVLRSILQCSGTPYLHGRHMFSWPGLARAVRSAQEWVFACGADKAVIVESSPQFRHLDTVVVVFERGSCVAHCTKLSFIIPTRLTWVLRVNTVQMNTISAARVMANRSTNGYRLWTAVASTPEGQNGMWEWRQNLAFGVYIN